MKRARAPRALALLSLAALSVLGQVARGVPAHQQPREVPVLDQAMLHRIAAEVAAAPRDGLGLKGAAPAVLTYRAGSSRTTRAASSMRLYRTGWLSFEPTLGIGRNGAVYVHVEECRLGQSCSAGHLISSVDEGRTWRDVTPTLGPAALHGFTQDPYVYLDQRTGRIFMNDLILPCSQLSHSDDGGKAWSTVVMGCDQADHQTIFAGPPPAGGMQPSGYPNVVYYCAINAGVILGDPTSHATTCARSLDGGTTFLLTGAPAFLSDPSQETGDFGIAGACNGGTGHGAVGPDGTIYLPRGWCGQPYVAISRDEGFSWTRVQVARNGMNTNPLGSPDHEAGVGVDARGNVYYGWVARDRQAYLAVSRDHGRTWGPPVRVSPPGLRQASLPAVAVGATGQVAFAFMGSTNAPGKPFPDDSTCVPTNPNSLVVCDYPNYYDKATWNGYLVQTTDALSAHPTFVGGPVNDPKDPLILGICGPIRCGAEFDFIDVTISPRDGTPWAVFVDACHVQGCDAVGETVLGRLVPIARAG